MTIHEQLPAAEDFSKTLTLAVLRQIANGIESLFAPYCEVVIHDFSDLEHSIIHLQGNLSNRSMGGAATDLLLSRVRAGETDEDVHNYQTELPNSRVMKSSTTFLRDESGRAYGAFCINYDITAFIAFQRTLIQFTKLETDHSVSETLSDDIQQTIGGIISKTIAEIGANGPMLSREDKIKLVARLDEKGVFQVKKATPIVAEQFGFSRATIYNYLREAREGKALKDGRKEGEDG